MSICTKDAGPGPIDAVEYDLRPDDLLARNALDALLPEEEALTILLADDDEDDRIVIADAFREAMISNRLDFVQDGEELLDYLNRRGKYAPPAYAPRPGLLLLDLNMPKKDGREALRELKANPKFRCIPVVILTTSKTDVDIEGIYSLGANSFITKPVSFQGLVQSMKVFGEYWFETVKLPKTIREN